MLVIQWRNEQSYDDGCRRIYVMGFCARFSRNYCVGALSIQGSSIVSLGLFANLLTIDMIGDAIVVNGKSYEVVITGLLLLCMFCCHIQQLPQQITMH